MKKRLLPKTALITFAVICLGVWAHFVGIPFFEMMELKTIDLRFKSRGIVAPRSEVVLAAIDEKSINREGKWMWPRSKFVKLVEKLSAAGSRVIAFDIGFLEPDGRELLSALGALERETRRLNIHHPSLMRYLNELKSRADHDRRLAATIGGAAPPVVLGYFFHMDWSELEAVALKQQRRLAHLIRGSRHKAVFYGAGHPDPLPVLQAALPEPNIGIIADATPYAGFFNMVPDPDGVVRRIPGAIRFLDDLYAPLSLMVLSAYLDQPLRLEIDEVGIASIRIGRIEIPTDELGRVMINYRGPRSTFEHISITDILSDAVPPERLRGKIVLVGATASAIYDMRVTPFGETFPGLEVHANLVDTVLAQDFLRQPSWMAVFDIMAMFAAGFVLWLTLSRAGVVVGAAAGTALLMGHITACQLIFIYSGIVLNIVYPLAVILLIYISITVYRYLAETRQKKFIRSAFSTYLAPSVVKQLVESPEKLVLGGEERKITAFFSDIQGFTGISEKLAPGQLVELLNEFLTEMTDIILSYEGTVDKFEGDAIIAFYGAPNEIPRQEEVACAACVAMQERLAELRRRWRSQGRPRLRMRIGMCTGPAVVGNMGSRNRMDYTMMGDTVNTAARLEGINKFYGTYCLICDATCNGLNRDIVTREIDTVTVVGKKRPVTIYELVGRAGEVNDALLQTLQHYRRGLSAYRSCRWDEAIGHFIAALDKTLNDGPSKTMLARCHHLQASPPDPDWDGVFDITTK